MLKAVLLIRTIVSADLQVRPTAQAPHIDTQLAHHSSKDSHPHIAIGTGATLFPRAGLCQR